MKLLFSFLLVAVFTLVSAATPVGSREYKLALDASLFTGTDPEIAVDAYWDELKHLVDSDLQRNRSGHFSLAKNRKVYLYDTQGSCLLYNNNLIFRERVDNGNREVTLKYRSADEAIAGAQDMSGTKSDAVTKFERDVGAPFIFKYSHSTTQGISSSKNLNKLDDPIRLYPGILKYNFYDKTPIVKVGNLKIAELVYKGPKVDLGSENAKFSLTLWYKNFVSNTPIIAEISFKYADKQGNYSNKVTNRSKLLFEIMQTLTQWTNPYATTKTAFVYNYDAGFCR